MSKKLTFQCADHIPFFNEGTFPLKGSHKNSSINLNFVLVDMNSKCYLLKLVECKMYPLTSAYHRVCSLLSFLMGDRRDNTEENIVKSYISLMLK